MNRYTGAHKRVCVCVCREEPGCHLVFLQAKPQQNCLTAKSSIATRAVSTCSTVLLHWSNYYTFNGAVSCAHCFLSIGQGTSGLLLIRRRKRKF